MNGPEDSHRQATLVFLDYGSGVFVALAIPDESPDRQLVVVATTKARHTMVDGRRFFWTKRNDVEETTNSLSRCDEDAIIEPSSSLTNHRPASLLYNTRGSSRFEDE